MLFAVDKYKVGAEREISAQSLYGQYIANRDKRFYCPECGEKVFWRSRGGDHPDMFYHKKKTDTSPECDKRVDGNSGLYLYQRVGLPMYICKFGESWRLEMGFPPLGIELLNSASKKDTVVLIKAGGETRKRKVNSANFFPDRITRIPIDIVPAGKERYEIIIQSAGLGYVIRQKWSDFSDGIGSGAFFQYSEDGGKRIKYGDSISPEKEYFLVAQDFNPPYSEIESKQIDLIYLGNKVYKIFVVRIHVSSNQKERYRYIDEFLKLVYGVGLLDIVPMLIPIWPPVVEREAWIPVNEKKKIICAIASCNENPTVYQYQGNSVIELHNLDSRRDAKTIELSVGRIESVISVDRKYVGREQAIRVDCIERTVIPHELNFFINDVKIDLNTVSEDSLSELNVLIASERQEIAFQDRHFCFQLVKIRDKKTNLPARKNAVALFVMASGSVLQEYVVKQEENDICQQEDNDIVLRLKMHNRGNSVIPPSWLSGLMKELMMNGRYKVVDYLKQCIRKNKITHGLLNELHRVDFKM